MHPALQLVDVAPCGSRGVIAAAAVPLEELDAHGPLVVSSWACSWRVPGPPQTNVAICMWIIELQPERMWISPQRPGIQYSTPGKVTD